MEELIPTLQEEGEERIDTLQEGSIIAGVQTINGKAGDLDLKTINGQDILTPGNLSLATTEQLATKQDALTEIQQAAVNSGIDSSKVQQIATNTTAIAGKQDQLTQTQLNAVNSGIDETKVAQIATNTGNITSNTNRITTIEGKIPSAATSTNQLTDKNYVDNAIATNTADYISDNGQPFQSLADLEAYSGPLTNNDYAFVVSTDSAGNLLYTRYKYNADQELWAEEYTIANPTFTSTQWAAIDSGVTANDVTQIGTNKSDIASLQSGKQDKLTTAQQAAVDSGIDATKVQQIATNASNITSLQTDKQDKLIAGTNIQIAGDGKTISATDTTYTAGTGLTLTGTQFSVTEPVPTGFFTDTAATQEGTGTTITLNNTTDAPIDNVELKGDTFQQTYTGKNLFNINSFAQGSVTVTNDVAEGTMSGFYTEFGENTSGLTFINPNEQISVSLSAYTDGNATTSGNGFAIYANYTDSTSEIILRFRNSDSTYTRLSGYTDSSKTLSKLTLGYGSGSSNNWHIKDFQIEKGSTATAYEPYVGGIPSPNPSYPQDIQVVTGEQTVKVVGKNLFDRTHASENYILKWSEGDLYSDTKSIVSDYMSITDSTTYNTNYTAYVFFYDASQTYLGALQSNGTSVSKMTGGGFSAFTIPANLGIKYMRVVWRSSVNGGNDMTQQNIMLNYGSTAAAYEPYHGGSYEINLGKNLFDKNGAVTTSAYLTDAGLVSSGQPAWEITDYIPIVGGVAYTLSGVEGTGVNPARCYYDSSKAFISGVRHASASATVFTDTAPDNAVYMRESIRVDNVDTTQIEAGITATTYAPYFTPIELCKIGDYQDYIWKDGADWKVHKDIGKMIFNGDVSEAWWVNRTGTPNWWYQISLNPLAPSSQQNITTLFCNIATGNTISTTNTVQGVMIPSTGDTLRLRYGSEDTASNWKAFLSQTNMIFYYPLATATDTVITDASLITQLDALLDSTTYAPQTNYTTSTASPNLPTILTVDVFKNNYAGLLARLNKAGA